jgi:hypothetical protein
VKKFKKKINCHSFIDMAEILVPLSDLEPYDFHLAVQHNGRVGFTSGRKKKYLTIEAWTDAFSIFASVLRHGNKSNSDLPEDQKDGGGTGITMTWLSEKPNRQIPPFLGAK